MMSRRILIAFLSITIIVIVSICGYEIIIADKTGPKITFSKEPITYTEGEDKQKLLFGVKAVDDKDGNVTDSLRIKSIVISKDQSKAKVTYAAKDSKNNVTTNYQTVDYIATNESKGQKSPDAQEPQTNQTQETTTVQETIDKQAADASGIPVILLTASETTIKVNEPFNEMNYIKELYDNSGIELSRRVRINGKYDNTKPGDYQLTYSVSDKEGNVSQPVNFTLHVIQ